MAKFLTVLISLLQLALAVPEPLSLLPLLQLTLAAAPEPASFRSSLSASTVAPCRINTETLSLLARTPLSLASAQSDFGQLTLASLFGQLTLAFILGYAHADLGHARADFGHSGSPESIFYSQIDYPEVKTDYLMDSLIKVHSPHSPAFLALSHEPLPPGEPPPASAASPPPASAPSPPASTSPAPAPSPSPASAASPPPASAPSPANLSPAFLPPKPPPPEPQLLAHTTIAEPSPLCPIAGVV
jgi:hypothetical protein